MEDEDRPQARTDCFRRTRCLDPHPRGLLPRGRQCQRRRGGALRAEATGAARSAVDELVDTNNALLLRVEELESRLAVPRASSDERRRPRSIPLQRGAEPAYRAAPCRRGPTALVSAEYEDYVPEPARDRVPLRRRALPGNAGAGRHHADWSTPSRLRDVPQPSRPPEREVERRSEPTWRRLTIEEGTPIAVEILDPISTKYSRPGDSFNARLASDLLADNGRVAIRKGAEISGHVAEVKKNQRIGGRAKLLVTMDRIELPDGSSAPIEAAWSTTGQEPDSEGRRDHRRRHRRRRDPRPHPRPRRRRRDRRPARRRGRHRGRAPEDRSADHARLAAR